MKKKKGFCGSAGSAPTDLAVNSKFIVQHTSTDDFLAVRPTEVSYKLEILVLSLLLPRSHILALYCVVTRCLDLNPLLVAAHSSVSVGGFQILGLLSRLMLVCVI
jgi:hypothetical protein